MAVGPESQAGVELLLLIDDLDDAVQDAVFPRLAMEPQLARLPQQGEGPDPRRCLLVVGPL
ncbi:hypothetical protein D3C72_2084360 [compost metagenome]